MTANDPKIKGSAPNSGFAWVGFQFRLVKNSIGLTPFTKRLQPLYAEKIVIAADAAMIIAAHTDTITLPRTSSICLFCFELIKRSLTDSFSL